MAQRAARDLLCRRRVRRRIEVWQEWAQDGWLEPSDLCTALLHVRLLDAVVLE